MKAVGCGPTVEYYSRAGKWIESTVEWGEVLLLHSEDNHLNIVSVSPATLYHSVLFVRGYSSDFLGRVPLEKYYLLNAIVREIVVLATFRANLGHQDDGYGRKVGKEG